MQEIVCLPALCFFCLLICWFVPRRINSDPTLSFFTLSHNNPFFNKHRFWEYKLTKFFVVSGADDDEIQFICFMKWLCYSMLISFPDRYKLPGLCWSNFR